MWVREAEPSSGLGTEQMGQCAEGAWCLLPFKQREAVDGLFLTGRHPAHVGRQPKQEGWPLAAQSCQATALHRTGPSVAGDSEW